MTGDVVNRRMPRYTCGVVRAAILFAVLIGVVTAALAAEDQAAAAEPPAKVAERPEANAATEALSPSRMIRVRLPLTGNADSHIKSAIQRVVDQLARLPHADGRRPTLVLELSPQRNSGGFGEGTDFTRALSLANYLMRPEMSAVKTVAYIPRTIKGHGVLVALACDQIAIQPAADLGEASVDEDPSRPIDPKIVNAYKEVIEANRRLPLAVGLGMVDRRVEVVKVETDQGTEYVLGDELDALKRKHTIISQETMKPSGALGSFSGREGRDFSLLLASDANALARGLGVSASDLKQDQSMEWHPVRIVIDGPITRRKVHQVEMMLAEELSKQKVNWIGITIDSEGGELEDCLRLAGKLAALDTKEVQTVAYVPVQANRGAALVALACDQLVMQPEAHIGI
ncbi:MAG TPA: hypothetical protein VHU84_05675, partial [Lacipirellulaceae bacterium]|nr:hypothetical protein [Lacipirellulaceae bacterium]